MLSLSSTAIADAAACLKRYQYHFVDRIVPKPAFISKPVRRGIWLHRGLQDLHTGTDWQKTLVALYGWAEKHGVPTDDCQEIYDEARLLLHGYEAYYGKSDWTPIATETQYAGVFGDVELRATIDFLGKTRYGAATLVEYKSTGDIPPSSWRAVDPQTALQAVLLAMSGVQIDGTLFDYIKTTPSVPRITNDGKFYANSGVTTSAHFKEAMNKLVGQGVVGKEGGELPADLNGYLNDQKSKLVDDSKFYQRFYTQRETPLLRETMADIGGVAASVQHAHKTGHYPRNLNVFTCRFCPYNEVCVTEYVKGDVSRVLREERFQIDDGTREGAAV